jgi:2-polyprenyl-6-methoxyphenol hydroxylase-like FAD-dependent oxidoreductase
VGNPVRSITIIGAGIGGLAAAAALRRRGIDVDVYEQADKFTRVGAGIQQSPNAVRVLRGLGIEDRLRQVAFHPASSLNRDAASGEVTNDHPLGRELEQRYGAPYLTLHRGDLHEALASIVPGDCVHLGKKLVAIKARGARTELSFADGSEVEAEAVIGADGVHSLIRDTVTGPEQPRFVGRLAYRTTFRAAARGRGRILAHQVVGSGPAHRHLLRHRGARRGLFHHQPARASGLDHQGILVRERRPRRDARGVCGFPSRRPGGIERGT